MTRANYWNLLRELTMSQIKLKDQSTFFGLVWSFLNPLLLVAVLYIFFRARLAQDIQHYALFLLIGVIHYTHFSTGTSASMHVLPSMRQLTGQVIFPKELLVIGSVLANSFEFVLEMLLVILLAAVAGVSLTGVLLWLLPVLLLQYLLVLWVSLALACLNVFVRDLTHIYNVFLRLLFFYHADFLRARFFGEHSGAPCSLFEPAGAVDDDVAFYYPGWYSPSSRIGTAVFRVKWRGIVCGMAFVQDVGTPFRGTFMSAPIIHARGLGKTFPHNTAPQTLFRQVERLARRRRETKLHALDDLNFEIECGEWVGIVGNNGSGKTTLLKLVAGLYRPSSGTLAVNGGATLLSGLGIGMIGELTVRENIFLYGALYGIPRSQLARQFDEIIAWAELQEFEYAKFQALSTGMRSRLAFSVACYAGSAIQLQDEALTAGDKDFTDKCYAYYEAARASDRTFLIAAHDLNFIEKFCRRTLWLAKGKQLAFGDTVQVLEKYRAYHA